MMHKFWYKIQVYFAHHSDFNYLFWSDLASAHYSKATIAWMDENLYFVDKGSNPPNVPQARPIENFWGCLAQKVFEGGWQEAAKVYEGGCKPKRIDLSHSI